MGSLTALKNWEIYKQESEVVRLAPPIPQQMKNTVNLKETSKSMISVQA